MTTKKSRLARIRLPNCELLHEAATSVTTEQFVSTAGIKMNLFAAAGTAAFILVFADPRLALPRQTSGNNTENNNDSDRACEANKRLDTIGQLFRRRGDRRSLNFRNSFSEIGEVSHEPANSSISAMRNLP